MKCPYRTISSVQSYMCGEVTKVIDFDDCIGCECAMYAEKKKYYPPFIEEPYTVTGYCGLRRSEQ